MSARSRKTSRAVPSGLMRNNELSPLAGSDGADAGLLLGPSRSLDSDEGDGALAGGPSANFVVVGLPADRPELGWLEPGELLVVELPLPAAVVRRRDGLLVPA